MVQKIECNKCGSDKTKQLGPRIYLGEVIGSVWHCMDCGNAILIDLPQGAISCPFCGMAGGLRLVVGDAMVKCEIMICDYCGGLSVAGTNRWGYNYALPAGISDITKCLKSPDKHPSAMLCSSSSCLYWQEGTSECRLRKPKFNENGLCQDHLPVYIKEMSKPIIDLILISKKHKL